MKTVSFILAIVQFLTMSLSLTPIDTNQVDYGGTERPIVFTANPENIIETGKSDYSIVIGADAEDVEKTAAAELQKYLEKIGGVILPIVTDETAETEKEIIVGKTNRDVYDGIDFDYLGDEGFTLKAVGKKLLIAGGKNRGVIYGVYTFLEEQLGCRWYTQTYEYIPQSDIVSFSKDLCDTQVPDFELRRLGYSGGDKSYTYKVKTNVTFYQNYTDFGGGHDYVLWDVTLDRLVPNELFASDPTLFALGIENGERTTDHVCLSNPKCLEYAIENTIKYIDANTTGAKHIHIGQKDNSNYCVCENCKKLYEQYGSVSAPTVIFANNLSRVLTERGYTIYVTFYAYNETELAPTNGLTCDKKVIPVVCGTFTACHCHPFEECGFQDNSETNDMMYRFTSHDDTKFSDELIAWDNITDRIYIYDYNINFINDQMFLSNLQTLQQNTLFFYEHGVTGYTYTCGSTVNAAFNELRNYLYAKIQWNVNADIEYYMDDFLQGYYGDAAPMIKEYLNYLTVKIAKSGHATNTDWSYQSAFYLLDTGYLDSLWEDALACELSDEERYRVETAQISWRYTEAMFFGGDYSFLNPYRAQAQEQLYDDIKAHGITCLSSLSGSPMPAKDSIDFYTSSPQDWR